MLWLSVAIFLHGLCSLFSHLSSLCSHCFILHGHFCLVVIFSLFLVISCFVLLGQLVCGLFFFFVFYLNFAPMWDFFCLFEVTLSFLWSFRVSVVTFLKLCVICLFVVILYVTIFLSLFEPFISFQTFFLSLYDHLSLFVISLRLV